MLIATRVLAERNEVTTWAGMGLMFACLLLVGAAVGLWYGVKMLRRHVYRGFRYLRAVNEQEQRPVQAKDIQVAFDVTMSEQRDKALARWDGGDG